MKLLYITSLINTCNYIFEKSFDVLDNLLAVDEFNAFSAEIINLYLQLSLKSVSPFIIGQESSLNPSNYALKWILTSLSLVKYD